MLPLATLCFGPAAAEVPDQVQAMIDAALQSGNDQEIAAVLKFAKQTNPDSAAEIDSQFAAHKAEKAAKREAKLAEAGLFDNWTGQGQLGGFRSTGNTTNTGVSAGLKLTRDGLKWRFKFNALADYQRSNGTTTKEQFAASLEPNYKFDDRLYAYGLAKYERDRFQGFSARYSTSAGIGYSVIATDSMSLDVKAGPAWRYTDLTGGGSESALAGLASADFAWRIAPTLTLTEDVDAYLQSGNSTLTSTTALDAKLIGALSARLSYSVEYESDPPFGRVSTDTISRVTLVYGF